MGDENGFSRTYPIELLGREPIVVDEPALMAALTRRLGPVKAAGGTQGSKLYLLENYPVEFADGSVPAQLAFFPGPARPQATEPTETVRLALQQSWTLPLAEEIYRQCGHSILMASMMSASLPYRSRREIVLNGVLSLLESANIDLIYWEPTQQMLAPGDVRDAYADPDALANPTTGFLNVRYFNIGDRDGEMMMDTLGLNALGLTDFQVHYRELDPNAVARFLFNLGAYAFEKGDVIASGHTIEGINGERWNCQHEMSLVPPEREVIDVYPGKQFAAGNRP